MTPDEVERLRIHVEGVEAWQEAEAHERRRQEEIYAEAWRRECVKDGPEGSHPIGRLRARIMARIEWRMSQWRAKHLAPFPLHTPASLRDEGGLLEHILEQNEENPRVDPAKAAAGWAKRYREKLREVLDLQRVVPSVLHDPLLQHRDDPRAGLEDVRRWRDAATLALEGEAVALSPALPDAVVNDAARRAALRCWADIGPLVECHRECRDDEVMRVKAADEGYAVNTFWRATMDAHERDLRAAAEAIEPRRVAVWHEATRLRLDPSVLDWDLDHLADDAGAVRAVRALCRRVASERAAAVVGDASRVVTVGDLVKRVGKTLHMSAWGICEVERLSRRMNASVGYLFPGAAEYERWTGLEDAGGRFAMLSRLLAAAIRLDWPDGEVSRREWEAEPMLDHEDPGRLAQRVDGLLANRRYLLQAVGDLAEAMGWHGTTDAWTEAVRAVVAGVYEWTKPAAAFGEPGERGIDDTARLTATWLVRRGEDPACREAMERHADTLAQLAAVLEDHCPAGVDARRPVLPWDEADGETPAMAGEAGALADGVAGADDPEPVRGKLAEIEDSPPPSVALSRHERLVLQALDTFDPATLASLVQISEATPPADRVSERTVGPAVKKLIDAGLAERPDGDRSGARLMRSGRRLAGKLRDYCL